MHATLPADGVQFVNENDARCVALSLLKQVAYPCSTHADKHLDKIAPADQKEWHLGFTGNSARQQCFTGAGRSDQKDTLRNASAHSFILFRVLDKLYHLLEFEFGLVAAGHIGKG